MRMLYQDSRNLKIGKIQAFILLLDKKSSEEMSSDFDSIFNKIGNESHKPEDVINAKIKSFSKDIGKPLDALEQQMKISRSQVYKFKDEVILKTEDIILSVLGDRVELATQAIAKVVTFYNDFLERQARYQQETPEQREVEKAWIAQKWRELTQVQKGIEAILNDG